LRRFGERKGWLFRDRERLMLNRTLSKCDFLLILDPRGLFQKLDGHFIGFQVVQGFLDERGRRLSRTGQYFNSLWGRC
jgi:hypothetical protein